MKQEDKVKYRQSKTLFEHESGTISSPVSPASKKSPQNVSSVQAKSNPSSPDKQEAKTVARNLAFSHIETKRLGQEKASAAELSPSRIPQPRRQDAALSSPREAKKIVSIRSPSRSTDLSEPGPASTITSTAAKAGGADDDETEFELMMHRRKSSGGNKASANSPHAKETDGNATVAASSSKSKQNEKTTSVSAVPASPANGQTRELSPSPDSLGKLTNSGSRNKPGMVGWRSQTLPRQFSSNPNLFSSSSSEELLEAALADKRARKKKTGNQ